MQLRHAWMLINFVNDRKLGTFWPTWISHQLLIVLDSNFYRRLLVLVIIIDITSVWWRCSVLRNDIKHLHYVIIAWWEASDDFRSGLTVLIDLNVLELGLAFILSAWLLLWLWLMVIIITLDILGNLSIFTLLLFRNVFDWLLLLLRNSTWCYNHVLLTIQSRRWGLLREYTLFKLLVFASFWF